MYSSASCFCLLKYILEITPYQFMEIFFLPYGYIVSGCVAVHMWIILYLCCLVICINPLFFSGSLWTELCLPKFVCCNPRPHLPIFGDRAFKEVIKVKCGHKGEALSWQNWCPYKKRKRHQCSLSFSVHRGKAMWRHNKKEAICKPGRGALGETKPADTLVLDF